MPSVSLPEAEWISQCCPEAWMRSGVPWGHRCWVGRWWPGVGTALGLAPLNLQCPQLSVNMSTIRGPLPEAWGIAWWAEGRLSAKCQVPHPLSLSVELDLETVFISRWISEGLFFMRREMRNDVNHFRSFHTRIKGGLYMGHVKLNKA